MSSSAVSGMGSVFKRGTGSGSPYTYTAIAEVASITGPDMTREVTDVTHLTSGDYRDFITGMRDAGTVALTLNFIEAQYALLKTDFESDSLGHYQIVFSDAGATIFEFDGLVTKLGTAVKIDGQITADATIKISGQVDVTP